jgi:probable selenium-dependent hydroxylase accessory protein YqeC
VSSRQSGLDELIAAVAGSGSRPPVVAFVGSGGKTSSMFALARALPGRVMVTTTTRILNPERASFREGRGFGSLSIVPNPSSPEGLEGLGASGLRTVLASAISEDGTKLAGLAPESLAAILPLFDAVLVEADGSRGLSIKAPSDREPLIPGCATAVVGLVGLDALGKRLDDRVAHRPELLGPLVGCASGEAIRAEHVLRLALSPNGLFKAAPAGAKRVVLLNKSDAAAPLTAERCAELLRASRAADAVVIAAMGAPDSTADDAADLAADLRACTGFSR